MNYYLNFYDLENKIKKAKQANRKNKKQNLKNKLPNKKIKIFS